MAIELFRVDSGTDLHNDANSRFSQFANASKTFMLVPVRSPDILKNAGTKMNKVPRPPFLQEH